MHAPLQSLRAFVTAAIYLILAGHAGSASAQPIPASDGMDLVLAVSINQQSFEEMLIALQDESGAIWIEESDFERLRLLLPQGPSHEHQGRRYRPLASVPGIAVRLDTGAAMLSIEAPVAAFRSQNLAPSDRKVATPTGVTPGVFLNYRASAQRYGDEVTAGVMADFSVFSRFGVMTNEMALRHMDGSSRGLRLSTSLVRDFPERMQILSIGDAITDSGSWGSAMRFGGLRFSKDFSLRPDLVTTPMLSTTGSALVPSTVDVFVNNQRMLSSQVQPGPFTIDNLPGLAGSGEVSVVVRDALGREQILRQSFYSSPVLLAPGLTQYSVAAGSLREKFALASFDYGNWVASANWRRGFAGNMTVEAHAESVGGATAAGSDLSLQVRKLGVATLTLAGSNGDGRQGWLGGFAFERRGERISAAVSMTAGTAGFRPSGMRDSTLLRPTQLRTLAQMGMNFGSAGSTTVAHVRQQFHGNDPAETSWSLSHSLRLGRSGLLLLSLNRSTGRETTNTGFLTYSMALDGRRTFETSAERTSGAGGSNAVRASLMKSLPVGEGHGWRVAAARDGGYEALWQQRLAALDIEAQAVRSFGQDGQSLQMSGAASLLSGELRAARTIEGSFAVVDVDGIGGVPVYVDNQLVAHTNARGKAVLHNLRAYEQNRISIAPEDLPLNTAIGSRQLIIEPAARSGVLARFDVETIHPAQFRLVRADGRPVPAGAKVNLNGGSYTVALDGFTYVTTLDHGVGATAAWENGRCAFRVGPPPQDDPQPDMGTILCREAGSEAQ